MSLAEVLSVLFDSMIFAAAFRMATPMVLAGVSGAFSRSTGVFNIAFECFMLTGAFFAAAGSYFSGSPYIGALCAMIVGMLMAALFGLCVFVLKANPMIISIALNSGAWAMTTLLLLKIFKIRGRILDPRIKNYTPIHFEFLENIPYLNEIFNDQLGIVYFAYIFAIVCYIVMYKTYFGLRLRGIGINAVGAQTAGVNISRYRWITLLFMGMFSGLAGSYMPLSGLSMFSESMTSGRGFLSFAAILVGKGNPIKIALVSLLFAYADALTLTLTSYGLPTQILHTLPYVAVILVMFFSCLRFFKGSAEI
jgi:ABC-type uncharacterized transport system permease subunit